jgi:hypothetical protein
VGWDCPPPGPALRKDKDRKSIAELPLCLSRPDRREPQSSNVSELYSFLEPEFAAGAALKQPSAQGNSAWRFDCNPSARIGDVSASR